MKEKVKIESVNKISQIDSIDVHASSIVCDLKLEVEKVVSADSEKFRDEQSAKSSAYQRAKAEFGVDVIADASYIIRRKIEISTVGWVGIGLAVSIFIMKIADVSIPSYITILAVLGAIICILIGIVVYYKATITGYAGHYINPRDYYQLQKEKMLIVAKSANKIFTDTPKLSLEEKKILNQIQSGKISETALNSEQMKVWKKQMKIDNKSDQTNVFYSVIDSAHEYGFAAPKTVVSSILSNTVTKRRRFGAVNIGAMGGGNIGELLKKVVAIGLILFVGMFAYKKFQSYMESREIIQEDLKRESERLSSIVTTCDNAIKAMDQTKVDSLTIAGIKWNYEVEEYEDSVLRYDEIRNKLMAEYQTAIGKILEAERKKHIQILMTSVGEIEGTYDVYKDGNSLEIDIKSIKKNLTAKSVCRIMGYDDEYNRYAKETKSLSCSISFDNGDPVFTLTEPGNKSTDGKYLVKYNYNNSSFSGEWVSKINDKKKSYVSFSKKLENEYVEADVESEYFYDGN